MRARAEKAEALVEQLRACVDIESDEDNAYDEAVSRGIATETELRLVKLSEERLKARVAELEQRIGAVKAEIFSGSWSGTVAWYHKDEAREREG